MLKAPMLFFFLGRQVRALDRNGLFGLHRRARKTGDSTAGRHQKALFIIVFVARARPTISAGGAPCNTPTTFYFSLRAQC